MDLLTFVSSIINSIAWPMLVAGILYFGRNDIFRLIRTVKSIKYDKFEMMFEQKAAQVADEAENISGGNNYEQEKYKDFLFRSPYESVMKSYMKLEDALHNAVLRKREEGIIQNSDFSHNKTLDLHNYNGSQLMGILLKKNLITPELSTLHDQLRSLRNMAAHKQDFYISPEAAKNYADSTITLIDKLNEM